MKLERMNENQIRCTLCKEDLSIHDIKVNELAYATDKARSLFKELLYQAADEFDFLPDDTPLMIEATPMSEDSIVVTITKVEDPEELDTRFAQFAPSVLDSSEDSDSDDNDVELFSKKLFDADTPKLSRLFSFASLDNLLKFAEIIAPDYHSPNTLFKDNKTGKLLLLISNENISLNGFNRICNIASEYGESEKSLLAACEYLDEHCDKLIADHAIEGLTEIITS